MKGNSYDKAVDLWCLGILIYEMLNGKCPFTSTKSRRDIYTKILESKIKYESKSECSNEAKDIIKKLLKLDPK